jgi:hypothetical protein
MTIMSKTKIIFSALTVVLAVATATTLKAKSQGAKLFCRNPISDNHFCTVPVANLAISLNPLDPVSNCVAAPVQAQCAPINVINLQ